MKKPLIDPISEIEFYIAEITETHNSIQSYLSNYIQHNIKNRMYSLCQYS